MADIRFNCTACKQLITCDELWAGHQIQCPTCQAEIAVPQSQHEAAGALVPKPPGTAAPRLTAGTTQVARKESALNAPVRQLVAKPPPKKSPWLKIAITVLVLGGLGAGGYYWGWPLLQKHQEDSNAKRQEAEKKSGGDAGQRQADAAGAIPGPDAGGSGTPATAAALPVIHPVWNLEVEKAKIPEGRVNGMIGGTNFVPDTIRVDGTPAAQVFRLTQGSLTSPDRELLIYLKLKAGETLSGHTWTVSQEMKAPEAPSIAKRWKPNPKYAPQIKYFSTGYAMKLEFGQATNGAIAGKAFISLPDPEQSVVAGVFSADTTAAQPAATAVAPTATPVPTAMSPADKAAFDRRYGPTGSRPPPGRPNRQ